MAGRALADAGKKLPHINRMFTSLRSRLWLSYSLVIAIALSIVLIVFLIFLIRNPVLSRQVQEQLRTAQSLITASPRKFIDNPDSLAQVSQAHNVRLLLFNSGRELMFDTDPNAPSLPFPRRNVLARNVQTTRDANGGLWLYIFRRLSQDRILVVAAPRPSVPVLNIFTDEFVVPILQGGLLALLLSLVLAFALSRWVADPLQRVVQAARNYPQGQGSEEMKPVPPRGPREVQDLTRAFNSMIGRVRSSQKSQRDFVANVSHELKTPLTSIQGFAQAILDGTADTPEARTQAAQIIYAEAGRMHRMALDLLDLARLEAGTADLKKSPVDISILLRNIIDKFTPQAQKAGIRLQLNIPEYLPTLIGDGDRLAQVFTNLVDNALKFTPADGQVTLAAVDAGGGLDISITDTGMGIPNEALPRLFERFYQVDPARAGSEAAAVRRGAGLGLAIAQEIVQSHSGRISVRSEVGHGTAFVVHLPLTV
jgi:signal transduction histidine kinase